MGPYEVNWRGSLKSPVRGFENSEATVSYKLGPKHSTGSVHLESTVASFGQFDVSFTNIGHYSNDLKSQASVIYNRRVSFYFFFFK
jgi:hypothetical protein